MVEGYLAHPDMPGEGDSAIDNKENKIETTPEYIYKMLEEPSEKDRHR